MEHKGLGKGLSALIPSKISKEGETGQGSLTSLAVEKIKANPYQPRKNFDDEKFKELVASIKEKGIIQPVVVRATSEGYELIAGERRLRAAKTLGLERVPVIVKEAENADALELSLIENIQRQDLNAVEEAEAYSQLMEVFGLTQDDISQKVGKSRSGIANSLRLLKLPQEIKESLKSGEITAGHGRTILAIEGAERQRKFWQLIVNKGLSVREAEGVVSKNWEQRIRMRPRSKLSMDQHLLSLQEELQRKLGTKVRIVQGRKKGKIVIEYFSVGDLERLASLMNIPKDKGL